ncbi:unnamed protein product [Zymoseptoria tritici ST99CH_3D1]|nr:unnamed protein product [Zymoseptoria tritici ST99CH_3D1]
MISKKGKGPAVSKSAKKKAKQTAKERSRSAELGSNVGEDESRTQTKKRKNGELDRQADDPLELDATPPAAEPKRKKMKKTMASNFLRQPSPHSDSIAKTNDLMEARYAQLYDRNDSVVSGSEPQSLGESGKTVARATIGFAVQAMEGQIQGTKRKRTVADDVADEDSDDPLAGGKTLAPALRRREKGPTKGTDEWVAAPDEQTVMVDGQADVATHADLDPTIIGELEGRSIMDRESITSSKEVDGPGPVADLQLIPRLHPVQESEQRRSTEPVPISEPQPDLRNYDIPDLHPPPDDDTALLSKTTFDSDLFNNIEIDEEEMIQTLAFMKDCETPCQPSQDERSDKTLNDLFPELSSPSTGGDTSMQSIGPEYRNGTLAADESTTVRPCLVENANGVKNVESGPTDMPPPPHGSGISSQPVGLEQVNFDMTTGQVGDLAPALSPAMAPPIPPRTTAGDLRSPHMQNSGGATHYHDRRVQTYHGQNGFANNAPVAVMGRGANTLAQQLEMQQALLQYDRQLATIELNAHMQRRQLQASAMNMPQIHQRPFVLGNNSPQGLTQAPHAQRPMPSPNAIQNPYAGAQMVPQLDMHTLQRMRAANAAQQVPQGTYSSTLDEGYARQPNQMYTRAPGAQRQAMVSPYMSAGTANMPSPIPRIQSLNGASPGTPTRMRASRTSASQNRRPAQLIDLTNERQPIRQPDFVLGPLHLPAKQAAQLEASQLRSPAAKNSARVSSRPAKQTPATEHQSPAPPQLMSPFQPAQHRTPSRPASTHQQGQSEPQSIPSSRKPSSASKNLSPPSDSAPSTKKKNSKWSLPNLKDLRNLVAEHGSNYDAIAEALGNKSETMVKNQFNRLVKAGDLEIVDLAVQADARKQMEKTARRAAREQAAGQVQPATGIPVAEQMMPPSTTPRLMHGGVGTGGRTPNVNGAVTSTTKTSPMPGRAMRATNVTSPTPAPVAGVHRQPPSVPQSDRAFPANPYAAPSSDFGNGTAISQPQFTAPQQHTQQEPAQQAPPQQVSLQQVSLQRVPPQQAPLQTLAPQSMQPRLDQLNHGVGRARSTHKRDVTAPVTDPEIPPAPPGFGYSDHTGRYSDMSPHSKTLAYGPLHGPIPPPESTPQAQAEGSLQPYDVPKGAEDSNQAHRETTQDAELRLSMQAALRAGAGHPTGCTCQECEADSWARGAG